MEHAEHDFRENAPRVRVTPERVRAACAYARTRMSHTCDGHFPAVCSSLRIQLQLRDELEGSPCIGAANSAYIA